MHKTLLAITLGLALLLRVVGISSYPIGFTQDEAGFGYDAYSILKTGRDEWGTFLPLAFRSFGDFKLPLYTYLTIPSVVIFGLNEFAVRLPNAILGTLAILATYLMVKKLTKREDLAIWSSILLTISPWQVSLSRGAFEANLTTFFMPLAVWLFYIGLQKPKIMWLSALTFGINLFSYHSARVFTPIILILLIYFNWEELKKNLSSKYFSAVLIFSTFLFLSAYTMFTGSQARALDVTILNPTDHWAYVADRRYEAVKQNVPDPIERLFSNKATYVFRQFVSNYLSYLSPSFLFIDGVGEWTYGMIPGRGVLYLIELIFILFAIVSFIKNEKFKGMNFIIFWLILSPIPAAISKSIGSAGNRAAIMMPAIQILSAYGLITANAIFKKKIKNYYFKNIFLLGTTIMLFVSLVFFLEDYLFHAPLRAEQSMHYGMKEAVQYISQNEEKFDNVILSRALSVPQIWVAFYEKYDPTSFQEASKEWLVYQKEGLHYIDQLGKYQLGKYIFTGINRDLAKEKSAILVVGKPEDFKETTKPSKIIYYPDGKPAIYIVENKNI